MLVPQPFHPVASRNEHQMGVAVAQEFLGSGGAEGWGRGQWAAFIGVRVTHMLSVCLFSERGMTVSARRQRAGPEQRLRSLIILKICA